MIIDFNHEPNGNPRLHGYWTWITCEYPFAELAIQQCVQATEKMKAMYPELKIIKGLAHVEEPDGLPTKATHCWLKEPDGNIVDPTAHQYPTQVLKYEPVLDGKEVTGKCPNCGGMCYEHKYFCSENCNKEYSDFIDE